MIDVFASLVQPQCILSVSSVYPPNHKTTSKVLIFKTLHRQQCILAPFRRNSIFWIIKSGKPLYSGLVAFFIVFRLTGLNPVVSGWVLPDVFT